MPASKEFLRQSVELPRLLQERIHQPYYYSEEELGNNMATKQKQTHKVPGQYKTTKKTNTKTGTSKVITERIKSGNSKRTVK